MEKLMSNIEFVNILKNIEKMNTVYMLGTVGQTCTQSLINSCEKRLPSFYTSNKKLQLKKYIGNSIAFDCCGLIKAVLWGFRKSYTEIKYLSNGINDVNEYTLMKKYCSNESYEFNDIEIGECVWLKGHIGVYIGDGKVIECTPAWTNNVQITILSNISNAKHLPRRKWTSHAKLNCINYLNVDDGIKDETLEVDGSWGNRTTSRLQKIFKTTCDGVVSNQPIYNRNYANKSCCPNVSWNFYNYPHGGSDLITAMQEWIGSAYRDGWAGKEFWLILHKKLKTLGYYNLEVKNYANVEIIKALQKWCNNQK